MNQIYLGDNLSILQEMPDNSVDLTFTSPPYFNARDYVHYTSYENYLKFLGQVFDSVNRITKEGRFCIVNTSPVIQARKSRQHQSKRFAIPFDLHNLIVKSNWEFIDDIIWVKPEGAAKNRNGGFHQHRKPLSYKPNPVTEYVMVYRKKTDKLIDWNIQQYDDRITNESKIKGEYERSNVWRLAPSKHKDYTATFPLSLAERVISYYSFYGDTVLDPFAGSGTTLDAAQSLNRKWIGIDQNPDAVEIIEKRLTERHALFMERGKDYEVIRTEQ